MDYERARGLSDQLHNATVLSATRGVQVLMRGLFQNRFRRSSPVRRRSRGVSLAMSLEKLEPRLALAGDVSRPLLERATNLYMDPSMLGPHPVVMSKSQVVGNDVKSFVISRVPAGSVVEKLDTATNTWVDVSTKPTSSNPRELLRLLKNRLIQQGDSLRWTPKAGTASSVQQAFEMIGWDDGSELPKASADALDSLPSEVVGLTARATATTGELFVEWRTFDEEAVSSYAVRLTDSTGERTFVTKETTMSFTGMPLGEKYHVDVWATNQFGGGKKTSAEVILPNLRLGKPNDNFFQLNQHLLPTDQVDVTGAAVVSETSPWGGSLAFPQVSYEAIMAATPEQPADVPSLTLPTEIISEANLEDGITVSMWVQARSPGMLLSSDYTTVDGETITVPYIWIGSNGVVNAGFYGPATGVTYGAEEEAFLSGQSIFSTITGGGLEQIGSPQAIQGQANVIDGTWHQITFVADKGSQALYVDGHLQGTSQAAQYGVFRSQTSDWVRVNNEYVCTIPLEHVEASTLSSPTQLLLQAFQGEDASGSGKLPALGTNTYSGSGLIPIPSYPTYQISLQGTNPVGFSGGVPTVLSSAEIELTNGGDYVLRVTAASQPLATKPITFSYQYMMEDATTFAVHPDVEWLIPTPDSVKMGGSVFPLSRTNSAPQTNYPQPYLGKVAELGFWSEPLAAVDFQALATAPLGVVIGANAGGHEYPNGSPIQQITEPDYAFTFQNGVGDTFANISPLGGPGVAVASALTQAQTATIPLPFIGVERLPNHQSFGLGLVAPLASGHLSLAPNTTKELQVALAAGDQLNFSRGNTNISPVLYVSIIDDLGNQIADQVPLLSSNSSITELTKFTLTANRTGSFKITLASTDLGNGNPLTFNYNMAPGPLNTWQSLFLSYRDPFAADTSVLANYADPLIPQINSNSNDVVGEETATGAANYFPLWNDSRYFPDTGSYTPEDLSTAYITLQTAVGYNFADLNGTVYHSPVQLAASLKAAYDQIVFSPPAGTNLAALAAVNQFFIRVNTARQVVVDALGDFGDALTGMPTTYSTAETIGRTISTNQAKFVVSTTAGSAVPNPVDPEHTNPFDIFDSVTREYLGTGLKYVLNAGLSLVPGGSYATSLVNPVVKEIEGLIWPTTPKFTTKQNSVLVSYLPPMNAQLAYSTLEQLGSRIDQNQANVLAYQKAQLGDSVFLNSVFSNWGLLELMENMDGSVYKNPDTIQGMTSGVEKLLEGVAWKTMVPAMFSWDKVGAGDWPIQEMPFQVVNANEFNWQKTTPNVPDAGGVNNNSGGSWLAIGDLNGDNYPDVVTSNFYHSGKTLAPGTLSVLLGKPSLESNPNYPAAGYQATNAAANGGGGWTYTDLTEYSSSFRTYMAENRSKTFNLREKWDQPRGIALGDFDGDGLDEAIVASGYNDVAWWYDISAPGTPGTTPTRTNYDSINLAGLEGPQGVVAADFNQDGWEDFAVAGESTKSVAVGINNKLSSLSSDSFDVSTTSLGGNAAYYITAGDLNGDDFPDLVVSGNVSTNRTKEGYVAVLMNQGNSTEGAWQGFELGQKWAVGTNYASYNTYWYDTAVWMGLTNPAIGDFTDDGIPDIAFGVNIRLIDKAESNHSFGNMSVIAGSVGPDGWSGSDTLSPDPLKLEPGNESPFILSVAAPGLIFTVDKDSQPPKTESGGGGGIDPGFTNGGLMKQIAFDPESGLIAAVVNNNDKPTKVNWNTFQSSGAAKLEAVSASSERSPEAAFVAMQELFGPQYADAFAAWWAENDGSFSQETLFEYAVETDIYQLLGNAFVDVAGVPIGSPGFFVAAVPASEGSSDMQYVGWNLTDLNGNPIDLSTLEMLIGTISPAKDSTGAVLPAIRPFLWESNGQPVPEQPGNPMVAWNGGWVATPKRFNNAPTTLQQMFLEWGLDTPGYSPSSLTGVTGVAVKNTPAGLPVTTPVQGLAYALDTQPNAITLSWQKPELVYRDEENVAVNYRVSVWQGDSLSQSIKTSDTTRVVTGVDLSLPLRIVVEAETVDGAGMPEEVFVVVRTSAPQNLTATPVSLNGLDIAWSRPDEVYGGSGTQITYEVTVVQGTYSYTENTTATTLSLPQGLVLGNPYTVTVLPKTQYGDGTPASLTQVYPVPLG